MRSFQNRFNFASGYGTTFLVCPEKLPPEGPLTPSDVNGTERSISPIFAFLTFFLAFCAFSCVEESCTEHILGLQRSPLKDQIHFIASPM